MRRVTRDATIGLNRSVLINKRTLFVCVTLDTGRIEASRESCLLESKTAVRIVTVTALHRAFEHLVMERQLELVFHFAMTIQAKLRLAVTE